MRRPEARRPSCAHEAQRGGWALTTPALDVTRDDSVAARGRRRRCARPAGRSTCSSTTPATTRSAPLEETSPDELRAQLETNVVGVHRVTRAVLPAMRARRRGAIVTLGSVSGRVALPMVGPYHASKWALEGMIEALRSSSSPFGIRVALVEPGPFGRRCTSTRFARGRRARADSPYAALLAAYQRQSAALRRDDVDAAGRRHRARGHVSPHPRLRWPVGPTSFSARAAARVLPGPALRVDMRLAFPAAALCADQARASLRL